LRKIERGGGDTRGEMRRRDVLYPKAKGGKIQEERRRAEKTPGDYALGQ